MTLETLTDRSLSDPEVKKYYDELAPKFEKAKKKILRNRTSNQGENIMNYEYQGYTLQVEKVIKDGVLVDYKGYCKELGNFTISGMKGYTNMINRFRTEVDLKTEQKMLGF